jgi:hypothetical protein
MGATGVGRKNKKTKKNLLKEYFSMKDYKKRVN